MLRTLTVTSMLLGLAAMGGCRMGEPSNDYGGPIWESPTNCRPNYRAGSILNDHPSLNDATTADDHAPNRHSDDNRPVKSAVGDRSPGRASNASPDSADSSPVGALPAWAVEDGHDTDAPSKLAP